MDLLGFGIAVLLIELTPGPNMAWLAGLAALHGRGVGLAAVAGVALGLLINGVLAAVGLAALLQVAPGLRTALRLAGASHLQGYFFSRPVAAELARTMADAGTLSDEDGADEAATGTHG